MNAHPLWRCILLYRQVPGRFVLVLALFLGSNLALAWQQHLVGVAVNLISQGTAAGRLADGAIDLRPAWWAAAGILGVAVLRGLLQWSASLAAIAAGQTLLFVIRQRIFDQVQKLDLAWHWRHGVGEVITRTTRDADKVREALNNIWRSLIESSLVALTGLGLIAWYDPWLALVPALLVATATRVIIGQTGGLVALDRATGATVDRVNQDLAEGVHGVRVIKAFAQEAPRLQRFTAAAASFTAAASHAAIYAAKRIPLPQVIVAFGHVWILGYGGWAVHDGRIQVGQLVASLMAVQTLVFRIEGVGRIMQVFADARSSAGRIWELLDAVPAVPPAHGPLPPGPLGLRLRGVGVTAPGGDRAILADLDLDLAPGAMVALVGGTGAGKSTLAALLPRLARPDHGVIALGSERAGWHDAAAINLPELRRAVQVLPQESLLFSDTLRGNLQLFAPTASDEELVAALEQAAADEVLAAIPGGLDGRIGDRGTTLSGGQRQRVCLARALLARPRILVLDDATSALDAVTERRVLANLRRGHDAGGSPPALLIITSRLATLPVVERVLLLADGRIAASGTHEELHERHAAYRALIGADDG